MKNQRLNLPTAMVLAVVVISVQGNCISAQSNDEAAVRQVLTDAAQSFEKNDVSTASKVWSNEESLVVFESGHANYGWKDYRDNHLVPEMGEMKNTKYAFNEIRVHIVGYTAWATMKYTIAADVTDGAQTRHVDGGGLATAILEKHSGRWQIVHWHSSAPRRTPAAAPKNQ